MLGQAAALGMTLLIETPIVLLGGRWLGGTMARAVTAALLASCLSHPPAWWLSRQLGPADYMAGWVLIEAGVCLLEAGVLAGVMRLRWHRALGLSALANGASALAGWWWLA